MVSIILFLVSASAIQNDATEAYKSAYATAYEKAARIAYRSSFIEQCRAPANNVAAAEFDVTPICACVADRLLAAKSVDELKTLPSAVELRPLSAECIAANPPAKNSGKP